jgi:hypothetical protein
MIKYKTRHIVIPGLGGLGGLGGHLITRINCVFLRAAKFIAVLLMAVSEITFYTTIY